MDNYIGVACTNDASGKYRGGNSLQLPMDFRHVSFSILPSPSGRNKMAEVDLHTSALRLFYFGAVYHILIISNVDNLIR